MIEAAATLIVAGVSARTLAESAAQAGWRSIALDLFGDADTRRVSARWLGIGEPGTLAIDPRRLRDALADAAGAPGVIGWVAGSGFEGASGWLDAAPAGLPRLGTATTAVQALREPRRFFATLERLRLPHPPVAFEAPADAAGWLVKRGGGTGGWHIRAAAAANGARPTDAYFQRAQSGVPMSVLFLADGQRAMPVALNRLTVRALAAHPYVYRGAIGPVDVSAALHARVAAALALLVPAYSLRGLASLDFIADGELPLLLEINPRPSASMALHADAWPGGLMRAHVEAVHGRLPGTPAVHPGGVRGNEIVFARRSGQVGAALAARLAAAADCHDLPAAGTVFAAADPVCSVSAQGANVAAVQRALAARLAWVAAQLESTTLADRTPT